MADITDNVGLESNTIVKSQDYSRYEDAIYMYEFPGTGLLTGSLVQ